MPSTSQPAAPQSDPQPDPQPGAAPGPRGHEDTWGANPAARNEQEPRRSPGHSSGTGR